MHGRFVSMGSVSEDDTRRFNVLLEDIGSKVKFIAEGHVAVIQHLGRIDGRLERVEADVAVLKTDVAVLKTDVAVLKTDVAEIKTRLTRVEGRLTRVEHHVGLNGGNGKPPSRRRPTVRRPSRKK
jgi:hypothetical protein